MRDSTKTVAATTTIAAGVSAETIERQLTSVDVLPECSFSLKPALAGRGTEIHATSMKLTKERLKAGLRKCRALLEAGEIPTGART